MWSYESLLYYVQVEFMSKPNPERNETVQWHRSTSRSTSKSTCWDKFHLSIPLMKRGDIGLHTIASRKNSPSKLIKKIDYRRQTCRVLIWIYLSDSKDPTLHRGTYHVKMYRGILHNITQSRRQLLRRWKLCFCAFILLFIAMVLSRYLGRVDY